MNHYLNSVLATVRAKNRGEDEFLQAVEEVLESLSPVLDKHPEYVEAKIVDRVVEPESEVDQRGFPPYKTTLHQRPSVFA